MLKTRIITALGLLFGLLAALFLLPPALWLALCALICAGAAWEWGGLARIATTQRTLYSIFCGLICAFSGAAAGLASEQVSASILMPFYAISALFWLLAVPVWLRSKWQLGGIVPASLIGLIVLIPPALGLAHLRQIDPWLLLGIMAMVWAADIAAYFSGRAFGRRKLAPTISPGKTWEGAYGAVVGVTALGYILMIFAYDGAVPGWFYLLALPLLLAFTAVSIIGDLFESLLKRQAGIKDSGSILPGHGGILDRIDSLTSTLPLAGLFALWLAR